jgi:diguanylate cyclase (GGDEF)-like protein
MFTYQLIFLFFILLTLVIYFSKKRQKAVKEQLNNMPTEKVLAVMNDIDKAILSNASFELLVESVLPRFLDIFLCPVVAISQLKTGFTENTNTLVFTNPNQKMYYLIDLDRGIKRDLNHHPDGLVFSSSVEHKSLKPILDTGANYVLAIPVFIEANMIAILYVGFSEKKQCSTFIRQLAGDVAARLGVALTTVDLARRLFDNKHFDAVTSLPNRRYCIDSFSLEISRAHRYQTKIGLLYIGLDRYKEIIEIAGYTAGDDILKQVGERLRFYLRSTDLIARFSDDAFVVILPEITTDISISKVAQKLIHGLSELYTQGINQFYLNLRIGISTYPNDGQSAETLLNKADFAMRKSKVGEFTFHTEKINTAIIHRLKLEQDLRKAVDKGELFILYQPQIDLRKQRVAGVEALVRWQHPTKGVISPLEFLPIAEETELIIKIGTYVRTAAFTQFKAWESQGIAPDRIAINISSKELLDNSFVHNFETLLQEIDIDPSSIEIEITESLLLDITDYVKNCLQRLRGLGVRVAIDDFGTGYSSLSYITQLPFDVLKLDRTFVSEIGKSVDKVEIVSLIIDMAHYLEKSICAEGVENKYQLDFLRNRGCELAQGYFLSHPILAEDFEQFVASWTDEASIQNIL